MYGLTCFNRFSECDVLYSHLHKPVGRLIHGIAFYRVFERLFQLGDVYHAAPRKLFEFLIVDIGAVHRQYIAFGEICGLEHEGVVGGCRCEPYVRRHSLVGVYDSMNLDAAFLFPAFGMASHAFEQQV